MQSDSGKFFTNFGMDTESSPPNVAPNDTRENYNVRGSGTSKGEAGYVTNIESTEPVTEVAPIPDGITHGIGGNAFDDIKKAVSFRYNSFGYNQILLYDYATNTNKAIYTDLTDSDGVALLPLDPQFYVNYILLVNDEYLIWTDGQSSVGFTNLDKLTNGEYGTLTAEDFSLIKPQPLPPITGVYDSDAGKASNFIKGKLFQFNALWFGKDYTSSAWSTWSKRIIPAEEATPSVGTDVSANNCIILSVPIGSDRVQTLYVGARYGTFDYNVIKTVDRSYIIALPNTAVNIDADIYEAYDPATGLYSFVFYNDSIAIPVAPTETDLAYDRVPQTAGAAELINGNIIALGDCTEGYDRPSTPVTIKAVGYDPNLTVPSTVNPNPLRIAGTFPGAVGSGAGDHKRIMSVTLAGSPAENDNITVVTYDIRDANATQQFGYSVPSGSVGDLERVSSDFGQQIPSSNSHNNGDGTFTVTFIGPPYYELQSATVTLFNPGPSVSKAIHAVLDNSSYQLALSYRDKYGRYFPLWTDNTFITKTPSFAQLNGQAVGISWTINNPAAPTNAVDYQWLITPNNTTAKVLDVMGNIIDYKGSWNAATNSPTLAVNIGTVGDTYQIEQPNDPNSATPVNLGNGEKSYKTGDYVVYNGSSWDIVAKEFGDLTSSSTVMAIKINPLSLFNQRYSNSGIDTVLNYDFSQNDRCTIHASYTASTPTYYNNPCIDVGVVGYDAASYLVKVTKSSSLDPADIAGKNIYIRLYSPKQQTPTDTSGSTETVWYEIGERFTITNGLHDTLTGTITDGDVYFKTRSYQGAVDPSVSYALLATDFNFSDFYESAYTSYGRPRSFNDELEATERKAIIRYSQNFILGSRNNGLTRFYAEAIYGEADGQTSSSWGAIGVLWQRGDILVIIQENNTGYAPINLSILEDAAQQKQYAISEKLINNIRYNQTGNIGIGRAVESFCFYDSVGWFIDPNRCAPIQIALDGLTDISYKMNKFFKETIQSAYANGKKMVMYYDRYYKEVVFATQTDGGQLYQISFNALNWKYLDNLVVPPDTINVNDGSHCTVSYDDTTGLATYTPTTNYVGSDSAAITFVVDFIGHAKNVCLQWTAGSSTINTFTFASLTNQPLSTLVYSNTVLISGNTIPVVISITGGQYSINGGAWTSSAGTVNSGDTVQVRQTTSGSYNTTTTATLTVGAYSTGFSAKTLVTTPATINWHVTKSTSPFVDANLVIKDTTTNVVVLNQTTTGTGSLTIPTSHNGTITAKVNTNPTGATNPMIRLAVFINGTLSYNAAEYSDTSSAPESTFTAHSGDVLDVYVVGEDAQTDDSGAVGVVNTFTNNGSGSAPSQMVFVPTVLSNLGGEIYILHSMVADLKLTNGTYDVTAHITGTGTQTVTVNDGVGGPYTASVAPGGSHTFTGMQTPITITLS